MTDLVVAEVSARDLQEILEDLSSDHLRRDEFLSGDCFFVEKRDLESDGAVVRDRAIAFCDAIRMRFPIDLHTLIFPSKTHR